jgi:hypothetical protein
MIPRDKESYSVRLAQERQLRVRHSRSGTFDKQVDGIGISGRKVHQGGSCSTSHDQLKPGIILNQSLLTSIQDHYAAFRNGHVSIDHHRSHSGVPESALVRYIQDLGCRSVHFTSIVAANSELASVFSIG